MAIAREIARPEHDLVRDTRDRYRTPMRFVSWVALLLAVGCSSSSSTPAADAPASDKDRAGAPADPDAKSDADEDGDDSAEPSHADVVAVATKEVPKGYRFLVTVRSPDTGCDRYADWWEVLGEDGSLLYRRILVHSHVDEQPFERRGGPVDIAEDTRVYVRAHLHPSGYGGRVLVGTPVEGFTDATDFDSATFAAVEAAPPQPDGCRH